MRPARWLFVLFLVSVVNVRAQLWDQLECESLRLDTAASQQLGVKLDALAFFRDNEYDSPLAKGYSLPGFWLQPRLNYQPLGRVALELGLHALVYNGANKYPNYAYHDIAAWKGNQYQRGAHVLPFFRVQADFKYLSLVLGKIHGAQNHRLILPLFNPEQNLSADPETGFQLLLNRRHIHLDTWINWQSYIFELDSHQEAFTVGTNATLRWGGETSPLRWSLPLQVLIQHRGGEQDTTAMGVQTLCNTSVGLRADYVPRASSFLTALKAEMNLMGSYQQSGTLWPYDTGMAMHASVGATLWKRWGVELGHVEIPRRYANLYGSPFFSTLSIKTPGLTFRGMHTTYALVDYTYVFSPDYRLGAHLGAMYAQSSGNRHFVFDFGVYFRVSPSFVIKQFRKKGS